MTEKYDEVLLPFLGLMRAELHANSGKGNRPGWLAMSRETAMLEVYHHAAKLAKALRNDDLLRISEHSADVANMAMMVLDVCGGMPALAAQPKPAEPSAMERAYDSMLGKPVALPPAEPGAGALPELRTAIRDAIADNLGDIYVCGRVWEAWSVGTMSEDDFSPAAEDEDVLDNLTDSVLAAVQARPKGSLPELVNRLIDEALDSDAAGRPHLTLAETALAVRAAVQARVPQESAEAALELARDVLTSCGFSEFTDTRALPFERIVAAIDKINRALAARSSHPPAIPAERARLAKEARDAVEAFGWACKYGDTLGINKERNRVRTAIDALAAAPAAPAILEDVKRDAAMLAWLSDRFIGADFDWNESGRQALCVEWPGGPVWGDLRETLRAAMAASGAQPEGGDRG